MQINCLTCGIVIPNENEPRDCARCKLAKKKTINSEPASIPEINLINPLDTIKNRIDELKDYGFNNINIVEVEKTNEFAPPIEPLKENLLEEEVLTNKEFYNKMEELSSKLLSPNTQGFTIINQSINSDISSEYIINKLRNSSQIVPCLFITGNAGTGKSFLIRNLAKQYPREVLLAATTGIAAINIGGKTINSYLRYYDTPSLEKMFQAGILEKTLIQIRTKAETSSKSDLIILVIEECSMMEAKQLDLIYNAILNVNISSESGKKFCIILVGDLCQLPPVTKKDAPEPAKYCVEAACWSEFGRNKIRLEKVWRQSNPDFLSGINLIRADKARESVAKLIEARVNFIPKLIEEFEGTTIIPVNKLVDSYNYKRLSKLVTKEINVYSFKSGESLPEWNQNIPPTMFLKNQAYVMILANETKDWSYVNGDCGYVQSINFNDEIMKVKLARTERVTEIPMIERFNTVIEKPEMDDDGFLIIKEENKPPRKVNFKPYQDENTEDWVIGKIKFYPIRLAYATTVHKSQGMTLNKVQVDITHDFFGSYSMAYVGISRAQTPENLFIVGTPELLMRRICTSPIIKEWI